MADTNQGTTKRCYSCKQVKPLAEFNRHRAEKDGFRGQCRDCQKAYYLANRERFGRWQAEQRRADPAKDANRKRKWNAANRDRLLSYYRQYRQKHSKNASYKLRKAARSAVYRAVRSGKIVKTPCEMCGVDEVQAHHHKGYDQANRLDVQWLCRPCHSRTHRKY